MLPCVQPGDVPSQGPEIEQRAFPEPAMSMAVKAAVTNGILYRWELWSRCRIQRVLHPGSQTV